MPVMLYRRSSEEADREAAEDFGDFERGGVIMICMDYSMAAGRHGVWI